MIMVAGGSKPYKLISGSSILTPDSTFMPESSVAVTHAPWEGISKVRPLVLRPLEY